MVWMLKKKNIDCMSRLPGTVARYSHRSELYKILFFSKIFNLILCTRIQPTLFANSAFSWPPYKWMALPVSSFRVGLFCPNCGVMLGKAAYIHIYHKKRVLGVKYFNHTECLCKWNDKYELCRNICWKKINEMKTFFDSHVFLRIL